MEESSKRKRSVGQWVAVLLVGMLAGSVMLTPAGAHLNSPLTFKHLKKHFYTKKAADNRFLNVGETAANATNATNATSAANADKLDNLDSAAFQQKCKDGTILAHANIQASSTFDSSYTIDPAKVENAYNCKSATNEVKVKRNSAGSYTVSLPGISTDAANTGKWVVVTGNQGACFFGCTDAATNWFSSTDGTEGDVLVFLIADYQPTDDAANSGDLQDTPFSFAVLDYS
jgi:hypothetical protein